MCRFNAVVWCRGEIQWQSERETMEMGGLKCMLGGWAKVRSVALTITPPPKKTWWVIQSRWLGLQHILQVQHFLVKIFLHHSENSSSCKDHILYLSVKTWQFCASLPSGCLGCFTCNTPWLTSSCMSRVSGTLHQSSLNISITVQPSGEKQGVRSH